MICGAGDGTFTQFPNIRFVRDCTVKPADASGHVSVNVVGVVLKLIGGLLLLNNWFGPSAFIAAISAAECATL